MPGSAKSPYDEPYRAVLQTQVKACQLGHPVEGVYIFNVASLIHIYFHMIAHTSIPVSNYQKAKKFYSKVLATLGYTQNMEYGEAAGFNDGKNTDFWIGTNDKGVIPLHVAFEAKNKAQVEKFYKVALAAGAKDNGAPGYRKEYWPGYYAAFVYDADGHNIEAVFYDYNEK